MFKYGLLNLWRNRWLSITAMSVMIITLLVLSMLLVIYQLTSLSTQNLKGRVDISVFFNASATNDKLNEVKADFEKYEEIQSVKLITAEQANKDFREAHKDDPLIQESLDILKNPIQPSLVITAKELELYPVVFQKIQRSRFQPLIAKVNYENSRDLIEKMRKITLGIQYAGIVLSLIFGFIAVLVMFNTLRLTIFSRREEIEIMKLVGASNSYIRGPFLVEGVLYGLISTVVASSVLYPMITSVRPWIVKFFGLELSSASFFSNNFWQLVLIQAVVGVFLGIISSLVATKKHLKT